VKPPAQATAPAAAPAAAPATLRATGTGRFGLGGNLTMATVTALRSAGLAAFAPSAGSIEVELGAVERADSSALALLIDWLAWARAAGRSLRFTGLPPALLALARLSDVEELLSRGVEARP
jgi:phospholipid transport system transporter-binding protein